MNVKRSMEQQNCDGWNPSSWNPVDHLKRKKDTESTEQAIGQANHLVHDIEGGIDRRVNP